MDSFDHLLCCARCCAVLLGAARCCSVLLGAARCCSVLLGAARCCLMLLGAALRCLMAIKNVGRAIEHFFCFKCCCALLGEMLDSLDQGLILALIYHILHKYNSFIIQLFITTMLLLLLQLSHVKSTRGFTSLKI